MLDIIIKRAESKYLEEVKLLLNDSGLPFQDIDEHFDNFFLAEHNEAIIGTIGIEKYSSSVLLRSFAVIPEYQNEGIGKILLDRIFVETKTENIENIYLLTTTAQEYFKKNGFQVVERNALPKEIQNTKEFKSICPTSAVCMKNEKLS